MDNSTRISLLSRINFGTGVAEHDSELTSYFVQTSAFRDLVHDEFDVILGAKGSGKTAISRILSTPDYDIPELSDVNAIPAFDADDDDIFSQLLSGNHNDGDEELFKRLWTAYVVGLAGNHLIESYGLVHKIDSEIYDGLTAAGLRMHGMRPKGFWERLTAALEVVTPEAEVSITETGMPVLTGRLLKSDISGQAAGQPVGPVWISGNFDYQKLFKQICGAYHELGQRCWILLDRLDEAFGHDVGLERAALRGLLRAHLNLTKSNSSVKTKVFLRSDIFDRITEKKGFVNLTHLRTLNLTWERSDIEAVVFERLNSSQELQQALLGQIDFHSKENTGNWRRSVFEFCFSPEVRYYTGKRYDAKPSIVWCIEKTPTNLNEPSPRNVLRLLTEARRIARDRWRSVTDITDDAPLMQGSDLIEGWHKVSLLRLQDTLYAEFNSLKEHISKFRNQNQVVDVSRLAARLGFDLTNDEFDAVLRKLQYCGFLFRRSATIFLVNPLYMPSLDIKEGSGGIHGNTGSNSLNNGAEIDDVEHRLEQLKALLGEGDVEGALVYVEAMDSPSIAIARTLGHTLIETKSKPWIDRGIAVLLSSDIKHKMLGTRLSLAFATGEPENAQAALEEIDKINDWDHPVRQLITGLSHDPELERDVWREQLSMRNKLHAPFYWKRILPIIAASRLLPVARGTGETTVDANVSISDVFQHWWPGKPTQHEQDIRRLDGILWAYGKDSKATDPLLFPYQVVSTLRCRILFGRQNSSMVKKVIEMLIADVRALDPRNQANFSQWAHYDELAREVVERAGVNYR